MDGRAASSTPATILIAEDERSILNLIATALASEGYQLLKAASGAEALKIVAAHDQPLDLVLTDAMMPGMSGPELARTLVATRPDLPVIVMSGRTHLLTGLDAVGAAISTLQKPFTAKELRSRVRDALKRPRQ